MRDMLPVNMEQICALVDRSRMGTQEVCGIMGCSRQNINDLVKRDRLHPTASDGNSLMFSRGEIIERL